LKKYKFSAYVGKKKQRKFFMKINIDNNISDLNIFETVLNSICKTFSLVNFNDIYS